MKALIIVLFLVYTLFAISSVDAAFVLGFHEEYPTAIAEAKKEKKLLMLVIIQDPCPYSERMVYDTLSDSKATEALKGVVSVIVDKHAVFPSQFKVDFVPMTFFIDPIKEEGIRERMGYVPVEEFLDDIKEARALYQ